MRKIILILLLSILSLYAQSTPKPYYQGEIVTFKHAGAYTYMEVREKTEQTFWVAVSHAEVKVGDYVRFQMELVSKNFKSKGLNQVFDELMFASHLEHRVTD